MIGWLAVLTVLGVSGPNDVAPIRVEVALVESGAVDLPALVERLAKATGVEVARPAGGVTLPVVGLAGNLSRKMLADALGSDAAVAVRGPSLIVTLDRAALEPGRREAWIGRLRELAESAEREAKRRLHYGLHALRSFRPNDPSRPTVCLIHGVNSSSGGFVHMVPHLEEAGFGVVVYDYAFNRSLQESCRQFARDWAAFRRETGDTQPWALVGHSMGCLLARDYVEGPSYARDVSQLVLIAPVNQGSHLAKTQTLLQLVNGLQAVGERRSADSLAHLGDGLGEAANDMLPGSVFLKALNARPRRAGVTYHILAGDVGLIPEATRRQIETQAALARSRGGLLGGLARMAGGGPEELADRLDEITDGAGDGCVSVARTKLAGVSDHVVIHANHAELIRAPLLFRDPGPVACMPALLQWLKAPAVGRR
jgi:pimeloyl-ACP methyl ester carboxylesterase